jgi:hypothetical protein
MKFKRISNSRIKRALDIGLILLQAVVISGMIGGGEAAGAEGEKIIATGEGFVLTQKEVAAFQDLLTAAGANLPQGEVVRTALKYELLSREYQKKEKGPKPSGDSDEGPPSAETKIRNGKIYIIEILNGYVVSDAVMESYYRSHPEKYSLGKAPDGKYNLIPIDDNIKKDIVFTIVEANKEAIVKKFVDGLIAKYHIQIQDGL